MSTLRDLARVSANTHELTVSANARELSTVSAEREINTPPRRAPSGVSARRAVIPAPHSLDGSIEGENLLYSISIKRSIKRFISDHSTLSTLRSCGSTWIKSSKRWNRCESPLCASCARQRANKRAAGLRGACADYSTLIAFTVSLSTPGMALSAAWGAQDEVRAMFVGRSWLRSQVDAWSWSTEITGKRGAWHVHTAFLLAVSDDLSADDVEGLRQRLSARWADRAASAGHYADPGQQGFDRITRTPDRAIGYAVKGVMATHGDSRTAGRILRDAALDGDADAAADWAEIESASVGKRLQGMGGRFRNQG